MSRVGYEVRDGIAEITLNNAPVNALTEEMIADLLAALERARPDSSARAVLLRSGVARRFCAGLDLKVLDGNSADKMHSVLSQLYPGLVEAQFRLGKPSIALVEGAARGGGMTLAVSCDMIVANKSATFGYPEIEVGLPPAVHFTHLHRVVGRYRAFDLLFTARTFDAEEAYRLGLVNRVFDDDKALAEARALAKLLAGKAPSAMKLGRTAFYNAIDLGYRQGVGGAVNTFVTIAGTEDAREGVKAFANNRKPKWSL